MFRSYRPTEVWDDREEVEVPVDDRDAMAMEALVVGLPARHRTILCWGYLGKGRERMTEEEWLLWLQKIVWILEENPYNSGTG